VPGFLLKANPNTVAHLNARGELVVSVMAGQPDEIDVAAPASVDWTCRVVASQEGASCRIERQGSFIRIMLATGSDQPIEIEKLVLSRIR